MNDLDELWRRHAQGHPLAAGRPDFRVDPSFRRSSGRGSPDEDEPRNLYRYLKRRHADIDRALLQIVTDADLRSAMVAQGEAACELAFELINLGAPVDERIAGFSKTHYLEHHRDVRRVGVNPLQHYVLHGAQEKRWILADHRRLAHPGAKGFDPERPTCLVCIHEMSRSGAPMVGLDLAREGARTHNVLVAAMRDGPLLEDFVEASSMVLVAPRPFQDLTRAKVLQGIDVDFAILNSAVANPFLPWLIASDISFVSYIHEYSEYIRPWIIAPYIGAASDLVAFSSEHLKASWSDVLRDVNHPEDEVLIVPQLSLQVGTPSREDYAEARARLSRVTGRDLSEARLICGAGQTNWRKGLDLFAAAAAAAKAVDPSCVFVWIGDGLNPEDTRFGVWAQYQLSLGRCNEPESNIFVLPSGPSYEPLLAAADAMFLSSRLDPLPNVVFDAVRNGCRIVAFEKATGFEDATYRASGLFSFVPYADPGKAVEALLNLPRKEAGSGLAPRPAEAPSCFSVLSSSLSRHLSRRRHFVVGESAFDVPIFCFNGDERSKALRTREREKLFSYRRRLVWRDVDDAREQLRNSQHEVHRLCRIVDYAPADPAGLPEFSVHIHAFYLDDLMSVLADRALLRVARRTIVTTDTDAKADSVRTMADSVGLDLQVRVVPNQGRDVLPFLRLGRTGGDILADELWCHIHLKKSLETTRDGDRWREFMLRILIGNRDESSIAPVLLTDPKVGLVAPLDPHCLSWGASRSLLPRFERRIGMTPPSHPLVFPMGNMFWARGQVVQAMYELFGDDYPWPNEPLAPDGTEFHLIERLWPTIAARCGLESLFIHKAGERRA